MIANTEAQRIGEMRIEKRGGTGTRRQASPGPRTTHSPQREVQGVRL
jgi:hypothetical protein